MSSRHLVAGLCAGILLTACGTTQDKPPTPRMDAMLAEVTEQDGRACIRIGDIEGFAPLGDRVVSVGGRGKRQYLVTTMYRCDSLSGSFGVGFSGTFSEVCGGGMGNVVTREETCPIKYIFEFQSREDAFAAYQAAEARRDARVLFPEAEEVEQ